MKAYIENIENLAKNRDNKVYFNSGPDHAMIVLINIFRNAKNYVETLCGNMCSEVCNNKEYLEVVDKFLGADSTRNFKILFDSYDENINKKHIFRVLSKYPEQVSVRRLNAGKSAAYDGKKIHFTVSDNRAFRLETDTEKRIAWGNFNDEAKADIFHTGFSKFFTDEFSIPVDLNFVEPN